MGSETPGLSPDAAMRRLNTLMAHLWMVRRFLKHAEEIEGHDEMQEVHRMIYDYVRALEPSWERGDAAEYLRRAGGKLSKLRRAADYFAREYRNVSDHTNFAMAAVSLSGCVEEISAILSAAASTPASSTSPPPGGESIANPPSS